MENTKYKKKTLEYRPSRDAATITRLPYIPSRDPARKVNFSSISNGSTGNKLSNDAYKPNTISEPPINSNPTNAPTPTLNATAPLENNALTDAINALSSHRANKPGAYQASWDTQIKDLVNRIMNREEFNYDMNGDALYQQYKDKYTAQAQLGMEDAIGMASAMTGGYGNSYAQSVGQQMYAKEMQNLNDVIPELYQMALDQYNREGQDLYDQLSTMTNLDNTEYGRYRDTIGDYYTELDYFTGRYDTENDNNRWQAEFDREGERDKVEDNRWQAEFDREGERNEVEDNRWQAEFDAAYGNTAADDNTKLYTGTHPETGEAFNNGGLTNSQVKELQAVIGVDADGYYTDASKEAAGGLSAKEAYEKYVGGTKVDDNDTGGSRVDPNSAAITNFTKKLSPESSHDAIARSMYGPYNAYVAVQIAEDNSLSEEEKMYLIQKYGITETDLQYARDKGYDI